MARVLLAWELGSNYGHLVALRGLARELKRRGHECVFAVRQLRDAQQFLEPQLGALVQAPLRFGPARRPVRRQVSYASLLHNIGFDDPLELAGRIRAWRTLYRAFGTEFVFADHSPVALIAARTLGLPSSAIGNGFTLPPRLSPFPSFRARGAAPQDVLLANEVMVLKELNTALERLGLRPFELLQDIFRSATPGLLTYAPLDHYETPRSERYLGMPDYSYGPPPAWPSGKGPKVFAYLRPGRGAGAVLRALKRSKARVVLRWPGDALPARLSRPGLTVTEGPVNFRAAAEGCDAFVNYGAHSTVAEFLLAGKPGLLLPDLQERVLTARRAVATGAVVVASAQDPSGVRGSLERLLEDPAPRRAAVAFAAQHERHDRNAILPTLVSDVLG
jgi:UDP:flavonoid glycosyltransferase YjiC (YdhE family)